MAMIFVRKKPLASGLLLCLMLAVVIAAGWIGTGHGEGEILGTNSSGNSNIQLSADPFRYNERYSAVLYNNRNGLPTSEANAIAQTDDGFIWIGSYAGLIRYDGNVFERLEPSTGISNARALYVDSRDRLWIGTNDSGVFLMDRGKFRCWNRKDGLESVSIRALAEDMNGNMYIASVAGVAVIDPEMNLTAVQDERISQQVIRDIRRGSDGLIYGLTEAGDLFSINEGKLITFLSHEDCRVKGVVAIFPDPKNPGDLYLGTGGSQIYYGNLEKNFASMGVKDILPLHSVDRFELISNQLWICAGNGIGRVDEEGFHSLGNVPMNNSIGHVMTDYEGNLWFTSSRQGVMKIVPNQFSDFFEQNNLPAAVVDSTCMYGQQLFIGTDTGLIVTERGKRVDSIPLTKAVTASGKEIETADLLEYLDGGRIRSVIRDSKGRLWISTWYHRGLIRYDRGELLQFSQEDGLFSDRVRMVSECEDGSILVANTGGVTVIKDDSITARYGKEDGIEMTDILSVMEGDNHDLILGSDGDGIYIFRSDGIRHIGMDDGLNSDVVMRIKHSSSRDVYWIVTGNSLAYMTPDYQVVTIREFPYSNCFDLYENSRGEVWVIAGNGIYVVSADDLLSGEPIKPLFYGVANGLPYTATANSFSELTPDGDLYIASSVGVVQVNIEKPFTNISTLKIALPYVDADGTLYYPDDEGNYIIPANTHKLTVYPRVFNYLLVNPLVSYCLEGFDSSETTVDRDELTPVVYTNLAIGAYHFVMTIKDVVRGIEQTASFRIVKGKELSAGTMGTILMIAASLLLMGGLLVHTSANRKGSRRLEDRLFFSLILANITLAVGELLSYLLEYTDVPPAKEFMIVGNTCYYASLVIFPYLLLVYLDYCTDPDKARVRKMKVLYGVPCFLFMVVMIINLKTGWIFSIGEGNVFHSGLRGALMFVPVIPVCFYLLLSLVKVHKISIRLVFLGIFLIAVRWILDVWMKNISSTSFIYTMILACIHLYVTNQPMNEEAL